MLEKNVKLSLFFFFLSTSLLCVEFKNLNGSDLMMGIGARQIALGGAGSLLSDSPGSIYWNAAGLAEINNSQLQIDLETPVQVNNLILVINSPKFQIFSRKFTLGISIINRLRFKGESDEIWTGYATHLLDLTMLDVDNFKGKIDSKTYDYRISFAVRTNEKLSLGLTLIRLV
ncbi:MAG: hypothetical protein Q7J16_08375 [Candidatus Cloacimonadales bacterium]|nr:hypothetical protein [Candidatus Cloacimonadales bacterium]